MDPRRGGLEPQGSYPFGTTQFHNGNYTYFYPREQASYWMALEDSSNARNRTNQEVQEVQEVEMKEVKIRKTLKTKKKVANKKKVENEESKPLKDTTRVRGKNVYGRKGAYKCKDCRSSRQKVSKMTCTSL